MANGHGGYRQPSNPAAVSGPGALSHRTDGGPTHGTLSNAKYGEQKNFQEIQSGAPLSPPGSAAPHMPSQGGAPQVAAPTPFSAPSQFPDMPVTAGANAGPGPDQGVLGLPAASGSQADLAKRYGPYLPYLIAKANDPSSSQEFRAQVRYLISQIG